MSLVINRKHGERVFIFDGDGNLAGIIRNEGATTLHMNLPKSYQIVREELLNEHQKEAVRRSEVWEGETMKLGRPS